MFAINAKEIYIAGAVPKALIQKEATDTPVIASVLPTKPKQEKAAAAPNAATIPPNEMALDLVNFAANGQTNTIPTAVGTAPTVLIIEEREYLPV